MASTTLEDAITEGDLAKVQSLVAAGAALNQKTASGMDLFCHTRWIISTSALLSFCSNRALT